MAEEDFEKGRFEQRLILLVHLHSMMRKQKLREVGHVPKVTQREIEAGLLSTLPHSEPSQAFPGRWLLAPTLRQGHGHPHVTSKEMEPGDQGQCGAAEPGLDPGLPEMKSSGPP